MPELFRYFGMRFFFYANDHLPIHVHVENADGKARFSVDPVQLLESKGIKTKHLSLAEAVIEERKEEIIKKWKEFFGQQ